MNRTNQDILPSEKANCLLRCLLEVSTGWTSQPWFSVSAVEGRGHSRSRAYRLLPSTNTNTPDSFSGGNDKAIQILQNGAAKKPKEVLDAAGMSGESFEEVDSGLSTGNKKS